MIFGQQQYKGFFVQWLHHDIWLVKGQGDNNHIDLATAQAFAQGTGVTLFNNQGHLWRCFLQCWNKVRKQVGANGKDGANMQWAAELVFTRGGNIFNRRRFFYHALGLSNNVLTNGGKAHAAFGALKKIHTQFTFEFFNRYTQRRLADITALCRLAKVLDLSKGDYVAKFGEGHQGTAFLIGCNDS